MKFCIIETMVYKMSITYPNKQKKISVYFILHEKIMVFIYKI
jgi:hypothetical protein